MDQNNINNFRISSINKSKLFYLLLFVFAVRIFHLSYVLGSPTTFYLSADETYYFDFALSVLGSTFGLSEEYIFMDPLYAYFLASIFSLNDSLPLVFFIQIVFDTLTVGFIFLSASILSSEKAGGLAALLYGVYAPSIMFATSLLKVNLVVFFISLWLFWSITLLSRRSLFEVFCYGVFLALLIALRSNLLLLVLISLAYFYIKSSVFNTAEKRVKFNLALWLGLIFCLSLFASRFHSVSDKWSFLPNNSGIVLHQVYVNRQGNGLDEDIKVNTLKNPKNIWFSYKKEAEEKLGRELNVEQVNHYWRNQSVEVIARDPLRAVNDVLLRYRDFIAWKEIPQNRSLADERLFSPVLAILPDIFPILLAFGSLGLFILLRSSQQAYLLLAIVFVVLLTVGAFYAYARFRFPIVPVLAIGSGVSILHLYQLVLDSDWRRLFVPSVYLFFVVSLSIYLGSFVTQVETNWPRIVKGYIQSNQLEKAQDAINTALNEQESRVELIELKAYLASTQQNWGLSVTLYKQVVQVYPHRHDSYYNLAIALDRLERREEAMAALQSALSVSREPRYQLMLAELKIRSGDLSAAKALLLELLNGSRYITAQEKLLAQSYLQKL